MHATDGAFLIDTQTLGELYPNLNALSGKVVITAAHCIQKDDDNNFIITDPVTGVIPAGNEIIVSFEEEPQWYKTGDDPARCGDVGVGKKLYKVSKAFHEPTFSENYANVGGNIGMNVNDFAVLILEEVVAEFTDRALLNHPVATWYRPYKFHSDFPDGTVGTAGYGLKYIGDPDKGGVGKPQPVPGAINKVWAVLNVLSTTNINIMGAMMLKKGQDTLCGGDSGSAAMVKLPASGGGRRKMLADPGSFPPPGTSGHVALGLVHGGDSNCRSTNTYARIDTDRFFTWVATVDQALAT